jgi:mannose-6-phosphate isomerase-like protein (cupin superfamily)
MDHFHHRKLQERSTLLAGRRPRDDVGFASEGLQIWYNNSVETWADLAPHMRLKSDECFVVLCGSLLVEVEGERVTIGPREFCCFPRGVRHFVVQVFPPVEGLMIRAPSVEDRVYREGAVDTDEESCDSVHTRREIARTCLSGSSVQALSWVSPFSSGAEIRCC